MQIQYPKIVAQMQRLGVKESDCREQFLRSPGKGGQNVNKVETAVFLQHIPTSLSVKCHSQRSQNANRLKAWELLLIKIETRQKKLLQEKVAYKEKIRRQKRGRSAKGKEAMLAGKKIAARKKMERSQQFIQKFVLSMALVLTAGLVPLAAQAREPLSDLANRYRGYIVPVLDVCVALALVERGHA